MKDVKCQPAQQCVLINMFSSVRSSKQNVTELVTQGILFLKGHVVVGFGIFMGFVDKKKKTRTECHQPLNSAVSQVKIVKAGDKLITVLHGASQPEAMWRVHSVPSPTRTPFFSLLPIHLFTSLSLRLHSYSTAEHNYFSNLDYQTVV